MRYSTKLGPFLFFTILFLVSSISPQTTDNAAGILGQALHFADYYNWSDAGPLFGRAEKLYTASGDPRNMFYAHLGVIRSTMEQRNLPETSAELQSDLDNDPLLQSDKQLRLFCLIVKGDIDAEIDVVLGRHNWEEVLQIAKDIGDKKWQNRASGEIGFAEFIQGDLQAARQKVAAALIGANSLNDVGAQVRYLAAIGTALAWVGSNDEALAYLDRALKVATANPDVGYQYLIYEGRLQALKAMGKLDSADQLADQIIAQARSQKRYVKETQALVTASRVATAKSDTPRAVQDLQSAITLAEEHGFRQLLAEAQALLANIYGNQGKLSQAEAMASAAAKTTQSVGELWSLPTRLQYLAELQVKQGKYIAADEVYDRAAYFVDAMLGNITNPALKSALITAMSDIYAGHFALLTAHLHNIRKAYSVLESVRGRAGADILWSGQPRSPQAKNIEKQISKLNLDLAKATSDATIRKLRDKLFLLEQARWLSNTDAPSKALSFEPISLDRFQRSLAEDQLVLEYVLAEPHSYCLVIERHNVRIASLIGRDALEKMVVAYLKVLKTKGASAEQGTELYAALLKNIPEVRSKTRLVIVRDGKLHLLPFDALVDAGKYLATSHTITYQSSASTMYLLLHNRVSQLPPQSLLGVGGISYDESGSTSELAITRGYTHTRLTNLPGSKEEITAAEAAFHSPANTLLIGSDATEGAFKHAHLNQQKIIHLAVHGIADEKKPDRAALLLLSDPQSGEDGILQTNEIAQLHTEAELVILSACDTAVGRLQGQEGIANLSRAFLFAGAHSVISTLWSIDDKFSATLMKRLYFHLAEGTTIESALALAKRDILSSFGEQTAPYYWAGFTLEGLGSHSITIGSRAPQEKNNVTH